MVWATIVRISRGRSSWREFHRSNLFRTRFQMCQHDWTRMYRMSASPNRPDPTRNLIGTAPLVSLQESRQALPCLMVCFRPKGGPLNPTEQPARAGSIDYMKQDNLAAQLAIQNAQSRKIWEKLLNAGV